MKNILNDSTLEMIRALDDSPRRLLRLSGWRLCTTSDTRLAFAKVLSG